jgi:predicted outer membrane repeat protein
MGRYHVFRKLLALALVLAWLVPFGGSVQAAGAIWYVKADASGANSGANWANAFTSLQSALAAASAGDQIWVAKGVYRPGSSGDRAASFVLKDAVAIYGGFAGSETSLAQRDWQTNRTVFSGDIDQNDVVDSHGITNSYDDIVGDNSYNVVRGTALSNTAIVDGVTVSAGHASVTDYLSPYYGGAGIRLLNSALVVNNLTVIGNQAVGCAGLQHVQFAPPTGIFTSFQGENVQFIRNKAGYGAGICSDEIANFRLVKARFIENYAEENGGAIYSFYSNVTVDEGEFIGNISKEGSGGAIYNGGDSNLTISNSVFAQNSAKYSSAIDSDRATLSLSDVVISENQSEIRSSVSGFIGQNTLERVQFINNVGSNQGGALSLFSNYALLHEVEFIENQAKQGGAIYLREQSTLHAFDVKFSDNQAEQGGAVYSTLRSNIVMSNGEFRANTATQDGGAVFMDSAPSSTFSNVVISGNLAQRGGAFYNQDSASRLVNATIHGNRATNQGGGVYNTGDRRLHVSNSIVWGNSASSLVNNSAITQVRSSLIEGCKSAGWNSSCGFDLGGNLVDADPLFVSSINPADAPSSLGDLRLQASSPALDQGNSLFNQNNKDLAGQVRLSGSALDLGAYERASTNTNQPDTSKNGFLPIPRQSSGIVWYVKADASGSNSGTSWANAFRDLQSALAIANAGDEIWVAKGVYRPTSSTTDRETSFVLKDKLALYGGFAGTETIRSQRNWQTNATVLSGDIDQNDVVDSAGITQKYQDIVGANSYTIVSGANLSFGTVLDGFTLSAAGADVTPYQEDRGAIVVKDSDLVLENLVLLGNQGNWCGGIANTRGSLQIQNVRFEQNIRGLCNDSADDVVVYNSQFLEHAHPDLECMAIINFKSNPLIANSLFKDNKSSNNGGALCNETDSSPIIISTLFEGNRGANHGGAIYNYEYSHPQLYDVEFRANHGEVGVIYFNTSRAIITNVVFEANTSTALFIEEYSNPVLYQVVFQNNQFTEHGAISIYRSYLNLRQVQIKNNKTTGDGAAIHTRNATSSLTDVYIQGNSATRDGGAILMMGGSSTLRNVVVAGNSAQRNGGAIAGWGNINLINVTIHGNKAQQGGAIYMEGLHTNIVNSIIWGNASPSINFNHGTTFTQNSLVQGCKNPNWNSACGTDSGNNLTDVDPKFVSVIDPATAPSSAGNLLLQDGSPVIDQGDNRWNPQLFDLGGAPRVANGTIDLGAYEWQAFTFNLATEGQGTAQVSPQKVSYQPGEQVQLSASAAAGWEFAGWSGTFVSSVPTPTLTIAQSHVITATFRNLPPIVVVGADQTVDAGATVTLDASESYELDTSQTLNFAWLQVGGTSVTLSDADTAQPSFTAPAVNGVLVFQVVVSDNLGAASDPVLVQVTVQNGADGWTLFLPAITTE